MERIIRITGQSQISVKPEKICVSLGVTGKSSDYLKAVEIANNEMELLKKAVLEAGLKQDNILTRNYSISEEYKYLANEKKFDGFKVEQGVVIKFNFDKNILSKLISNISSNTKEGAKLRVYFEADEKKVQERLLEEAVDNAKKDAEILAKASGVKLGKIKLINHSFNRIDVRYKGSEMNFEGARMLKMSSNALSEINVENIIFDASVDMEWEIDD